MRLEFTKMHGIGNDFVVIDAISQQVALDPNTARRIADRHFGVGCDQILVVERPTRDDTDFRYRIYNSDGGEVEHCGNGARCFARYVRDSGLTAKSVLRVETLAGILELRIEADGRVTVDMGVPRFAPAEVPFVCEREQATYRIPLQHHSIEASVLSMGNPHCVQFVDRFDDATVAREGEALQHHAAFPARVNAGFVVVVARDRIRLRVYERGAGETLACGTGACAAVVAGIERGLLTSPVTVDMRGGALTIAWAGRGQPVLMTGPTETVYTGLIELH